MKRTIYLKLRLYVAHQLFILCYKQHLVTTLGCDLFNSSGNVSCVLANFVQQYQHISPISQISIKISCQIFFLFHSPIFQIPLKISFKISSYVCCIFANSQRQISPISQISMKISCGGFLRVAATTLPPATTSLQTQNSKMAKLTKIAKWQN